MSIRNSQPSSRNNLWCSARMGRHGSLCSLPLCVRIALSLRLHLTYRGEIEIKSGIFIKQIRRVKCFCRISLLRSLHVSACTSVRVKLIYIGALPRKMYYVIFSEHNLQTLQIVAFKRPVKKYLIFRSVSQENFLKIVEIFCRSVHV
jgi:hypothetical protein